MPDGENYPGITKPLSVAESSDADKAATIELEKTLKEHNMYESAERAQLRQTILKRLDKMTKTFVYHVSKRDGMTDVQALKSGGKVMTYGSYRLGVHGRDSDIDTLCVFPSHVRRSDFFKTMLQLLQREECVKDITAVIDAYVPVIKFKYSGISIDLVCARLAVSEVPDDINLSGTSILSRLEEKCIRSLNGTRVADDILSLVPNITTFRITLRCIKLWATQKAVYSNVLGFLGGVAWAVLAARICQLYPNASASTVISKFFHIMTTWTWPTPIILRKLEDGHGIAQFNSWNPRVNISDKAHRMPIITPTYPHMCTTHNVSASTQRILMGEFKMAAKTIDRIMISGAPWSLLFEPSKFFELYDHYLQIVVSGDSCDQLRIWSGLVEAKLRILLAKLEALPNIALVHPYMNSFNKETQCHSKQDIDAAVHAKQLQTKGLPTVNGNGDNSRTIWTKTFYMGLYIRSEPGTTGSVDLTQAITEFKKLLKSSPTFNSLHMGVTTSIITNDQLPAEALFPNESKKDDEIKEVEQTILQHQQTITTKRSRQGSTSQGNFESKKARTTPPTIESERTVVDAPTHSIISASFSNVATTSS